MENNKTEDNTMENNGLEISTIENNTMEINTYTAAQKQKCTKIRYQTMK